MEMAVESMEMAPGAIPRPGRVPEQRLSVPRILSAMVAALRNVSWTEADCFRVFVLERIYRRKRRREAVSEVGSPPPGAGQARPHLGEGGCGHLVTPLRLCFWLPGSSYIIEFL